MQGVEKPWFMLVDTQPTHAGGTVPQKFCVHVQPLMKIFDGFFLLFLDS